MSISCARILLWDFDGTLAYRPGLWSSAVLEACDRVIPGHPLTIADIRPHLRTGFPWHTPTIRHPHITTADQWWRELHPAFIRTLLACNIETVHLPELLAAIRFCYCDPVRWKLFDDAIPALHTLTQAGWRHRIISNHVPELPDIIAHLGLASSFEAIYCSATGGYEKPHPQSFQSAIESIGEPRTLWMIGDNLQADIQGAAMLGIPGILVRSIHSEAGYSCQSLLDIVNIVDRS